MKYERQEVVEVDELEEIQGKREAEGWCLAVNELMERVRDKYWAVEHSGDAKQTMAFIKGLESSLDSVIGDKS